MPWRQNCEVRMDNNHILSLLGLALRGGNLAVGEEPVETVVRARDARVLLLADDAAANTRRRVEHFAALGQCLWLRVPFIKDELGRAVGRSSAAILALSDIGLAAAVVHRLAALDPVQYDEAAAKLDLKAQRAAERKNELLAHEKNLKVGKRKPKSPAAPAAQPTPESTTPRRPGGPRADGPRKSGDGPWKPSRPGGPRADGPRKNGDGPWKPSRPGGPRADGPRKSGDGPWKPSRPGGPRADGPRRPGDGPWKPSRPGGPRADGPRKPSDGPWKSRPTKDKRPKPKVQVNPYAHSHPVKKGKGSFRKQES